MSQADDKSMEDEEKKCRNFVLTLWLHMTERCWEERLTEMIEEGEMAFVAYGQEVCPTSGTLHYQAFCSFENARSPASIRKLFKGCYVAPMYGPWKANEDYCSKESTLTVLGTRPSQGARTDLYKVKRLIEQGQTTMGVAEMNDNFATVAKYDRFIEKYEHHIRAKRIKLDREMPKLYIRVGQAGTGKTKWLDDTFGLDGWARMPQPTHCWWITPTVSRAETVLIDDVGPTKIPSIEQFLEWTDRYPIEFNSKGGYLWWKPKNIVVTSNLHPYEWWPNITEAHKAALERRIYSLEVL